MSSSTRSTFREVSRLRAPKGLQLEVTMEDPKVLTAPLIARVTYRRLISEWQESACADNPMEHYKDEWIGLRKANHPDF